MKITLLLASLTLTLGLQAPSMAQSADDNTAVAIFAGGCFWCMEEAFEKVDGVVEAVSGYIGGSVANPSYRQVSAGRTGHAEAIEVIYQPERVSYQDLLRVFWRNIDPTTPNRQFCDGGSQYRAEIFYMGAEQKAQAEASLADVEANKPFDKPIVTGLSAAGEFYPAEDYHQDYYKKNPSRYKFYKWNCGRAQRLEELWGPSEKG
jgi:peptide-methionine (S)-S-oxide reductase